MAQCAKALFQELTNALSSLPRSVPCAFSTAVFFLCALLSLSRLLASLAQVGPLKRIALLLGVILGLSFSQGDVERHRS